MPYNIRHTGLFFCAVIVAVLIAIAPTLIAYNPITGLIAKPSNPTIGKTADGISSPSTTCRVTQRDDEILIQLAENVSLEEINDTLSGIESVATKALSENDVALGWAKLDIARDSNAVEATSDLLLSSAIQNVQPNFVYHALDNNAAQAPAASALDSYDLQATSSKTLQVAADDTLPWHLQAIGAKAAWENYKADASATVAIVDSGCDTSNSNLSSVVNRSSAYNVLTNTSNVSDTYGHGTMVAEVVASVLNGANKQQADSGCTLGIMPVKVMTDGETDTINLVKAYDYILKKRNTYNVRVVSMSLGGIQDSAAPVDMATIYAVDRAYDAGIVSVFAGGNSGNQAPYYCFPCDFSENGLGVINVKRYDSNDEPTKDNLIRDNSSNYNKQSEKTKSISAPGTDIETRGPKNKAVSMTGTSFACPVVAGVAALVLSANPALTAGEAKSVICTAADDLVYANSNPHATYGFDDVTGYGLVRADKAVEGASDAYLSGFDSLGIGGSTTLSVPQSQQGKTWQWKSGAPSIATVNTTSGRVVGLSHGEAVISATDGSQTLQRTVVVYETRPLGNASMTVGEVAVMNTYSNPVAAWKYASSNPSVASVGSETGIITAKNTGTTTITATHSILTNVITRSKITVEKAANTLSVKTKKVRLKASKVRTKTRKVKRSKAFTVKKAKGTVTYKVKKYDTRAGKRIKVSKSGKVTVKKGLKRGTYKLKVKVTAAGNKNYKKKTKTVTLSVVIS